ncbi:MAG: FAD-dependent thymidylate synthase [Alphaproteobacteria bacterium]|jgi:thymidylate synthase (FAD)|nr:FAD-dependent thymidylate synthase [Alphaproteobacteria bacterium]
MIVKLINHMGNDLTVVNAARVSYGSESKTLEDKDKGLISYLAKHKHMSPFRHVYFTFLCDEIPEFIARQLYKHQVGCGYSGSEFRESATSWNEISQRYKEVDGNSFYKIPSFRKQSANNKQGSIWDSTIEQNEEAVKLYEETLRQNYETYKKLLSMGVCKEQARAILPLAVFTSFYWTASLEAAVHFVKLRKHVSAQYEISLLAAQVEAAIREVAPISVETLLGNQE